MKRLALLIFGVACLVVAFAASPAFATTGMMTITKSTTLTADHVGNIVIAKDKVTLDCAGHTITSPTPGTGYGVDLQSRTRVTVRNCVVTGFSHAFNLYRSGDNSFASNRTINNAIGFAVGHGSSGNTFTGNVTSNDRIHGFWIHTGDDGPVTTGNTLRGNTSTGSEVGVKVDNCTLPK